jgi:hypothetical protein
MVRLRPDSFDPQVNTSPGELTLFQGLSQTKKAPNWTVIHSLDILHHQSKVQGEADFVVLAPSLGLLVIEVKHHAKVELSHGTWILGGVKAKDPYRQASDGAFSIKQYLENQQIDTKALPIMHAVWFTRCSTKHLPESIEWDLGTTLGVEDLKSDPVDAIERIFRQGRQRLEKTVHFHSPVADSSLLDRVMEALTPSFTIHQPPKDRKQEVLTALKSATAEQLTTLELLKNQQQLVVPGMAGTGKTFLAIQEAKEAHLRGEQTLLICFNKMLAQQLALALTDFPRVKVSTIHSLLLDHAAGQDPVGKSDKWWSEELPQLASDSLIETGEVQKFETLIIDEAQDVGTSEYLEFLDLILYSGLNGSKVKVFGDFRYQAIYLDGSESLANFKRHLSKHVETSELRINCRNTQLLGDFLRYFLELEPGYTGFRRTDKGENVDQYQLNSVSEYPRFLNKALEDLTKIYSPNDIVVLSSNLKKLEELTEKCDHKFSKIDFLNSGRIRFGSIHKFKGLEALAVVLVDFPESKIGILDTFYQAATRSTSRFAYLITSERLAELVGGD